MVYLNEFIFYVGFFLCKMKHLGMVKCEDRREFAGNSERLSMRVLMGYNFHPAMSLLIQSEGMGCSSL